MRQAVLLCMSTQKSAPASKATRCEPSGENLSRAGSGGVACHSGCSVYDDNRIEFVLRGEPKGNHLASIAPRTNRSSPRSFTPHSSSLHKNAATSERGDTTSPRGND